ncbi:hypothetical protein C1646_749666 [Rhizophagus diaphanus]|nr:hypothetical protein C1646_749666 [Rhizophagus diaphanus] [Rhizophagus sp. MUCL 43196]
MSLKDKNEMLMSINEAFSQENEQLNDKIKQFRSFRIPRSLQLTQLSSQPRLSDEDLVDGEDENSFHPVKHKHHKAKEKRIARNDDREECDNEEAQVEETFASEVNTEIRRKLVPELLKAMKPRYNPSYDQLKRDERLAKYDKLEIYRILQDNDFHSPKLSVTDNENPSLKHNINVYDLSWRSDKLRHLLRNILDPYSLSLQSAQLTRPQNYNDAIYIYRQPPPTNVPDWTRILIDVTEEHQRGESSTHREICGALLQLIHEGK